MMLFMNMLSYVTLGNVKLDNVTSIKITESINEVSNVAKLTIPKHYRLNDQKTILEQFKVGDPVTISFGYYKEDNVDIEVEFTGYIREIESDLPLVLLCEDESYILRQTNVIKSWRSATLLQVLREIVPSGITVECPVVPLGRFQIDNASVYDVLNKIKEDYGLYSRLKNGVLRVGLRDLVDMKQMQATHAYVLNPTSVAGDFTKSNDLKFKRKTDFKLKVKVTCVDSANKKKTVEVGSKDADASVINITYPGSFTEAELRKYGESIYNKRCYDGYTGSITGFGTPRTHAGDALQIEDKDDISRSGKYLIEAVDITYSSDSGISRNNTLSYRLDN